MTRHSSVESRETGFVIRKSGASFLMFLIFRISNPVSRIPDVQ